MPEQSTDQPGGPSLWGTALAVWSTFEGSMMAGWLIRSLGGAWPSEVQSSFQLETWTQSIGGFLDVIATFTPWDAFLLLLATAPILLPVFVVPLLGLVALWDRRRDPMVVGSFAAFISLDILEFFNQGASRGVWLFGWALGIVGATCLVVTARHSVPTSSWPFLAVLALAAALNRWWPLAFLVVTAQAAWCLLRAAKRRRHHAGRGDGSVIDGDAEQADAADEARS